MAWSMQRIGQEVGKNMEAWASSLIFGFLLSASLVWLVSLINDRYIKREKYLSRLILKRARKD